MDIDALNQAMKDLGRVDGHDQPAGRYNIDLELIDITGPFQMCREFIVASIIVEPAQRREYHERT